MSESTFSHTEADLMDTILSLDEHIELKQAIYDRGSNLSKRPNSKVTSF